jgi:Zn-dependent protease with chaperone function
MIRNKKELKGLNHKDYEHPFDRKALVGLEKTPGLKIAGTYVTKHTIERIYTVQYTGSNIRVSKQNYPAIYELLEYACQVLDVPQIPDFYLEWGYNINGFTTGADKPLIVLNSGVIDLCDDDEKLFIIGHECGHIKSMHMLYHMMAQVINSIVNEIPGGNLVTAPLQYALYYWSRMSEFTADRAGLLCCQNKNAAIRAFMKMAGMPQKHFTEMNYTAFIDQAKEFKHLDEKAMNKIVKFISIMDQSHPWTVMRAAELLNWINAGEYDRFVGKDTPLKNTFGIDISGIIESFK